MVSNESPDYTPGFYLLEESCMFPQLVELQLSLRSNAVFETFDLTINLTFGEHILRSTNAGSPPFGLILPFVSRPPFRLRIKNAKLSYELSGCKIPIAGKYRKEIQAASITMAVKEKSTSARKWSGGLKAMFGASASQLQATASASGNAEFSAASGSSRESSRHIIPQIAIVEHEPLGWKVGHGVMGDPRHSANDCCLTGSYFVDDDREPRGCKVSLIGEAATLRFVVSVRDGFFVDRLAGDGSYRGVGSGARAKAIQNMRSSIGGIWLEKQIAAEQGALDSGRVFLASAHVRAVRELDEAASLKKPRPAPDSLDQSGRDVGEGRGLKARTTARKARSVNAIADRGS